MDWISGKYYARKHKQNRCDVFCVGGVRSFICWTIQIWWNLFVSDAVNRNRLTSQVLCSAIVLIPPIIISEVYSSMARLLSPTYGTYLITTWKKIETVCQLMSVNTDTELVICLCLRRSHLHSGQVSLLARTVWGWTGPCRPPHCS